jgi:hypothetical protein
MQMLFGFMTSQAIFVAAKLGLADLLKNGAKSVDELAQATGVQARPLYRIMRVLASVGIFVEDDNGRYQMTPLAEPLRGDVPNSLRDFSIFLGADWLCGDHKTSRCRRRARFTPGLDPAKEPADERGLFDAPSVIAGAGDVIQTHGVGERCDAIGGDFFVSVPAGGDAYIIKHIIHNWDDDRASAILQNCRRAMVANGKLLVVEMVIPAGNAPSLGKLLDLEMLVLFLHACERRIAPH